MAAGVPEGSGEKRNALLRVLFRFHFNVSVKDDAPIAPLFFRIDAAFFFPEMSFPFSVPSTVTRAAALSVNTTSISPNEEDLKSGARTSATSFAVELIPHATHDFYRCRNS